MDKKKAYKVITPVGNIYVDAASEAQEYKHNYGYPYCRTCEQDNE
jgi:hypothetical protein